MQIESALGIGRRSDIVDGAIHVLGTCGSRGLTHRAIDKYLGLPEGSSSNYFRTRRALEIAIFIRVIEIDIDVLTSAVAKVEVLEPGVESAILLFEIAINRYLGEADNVINQRARFEIYLMSASYPILFELVDTHRRAFRMAIRELLAKLNVNLSESTCRTMIALAEGIFLDSLMATPGDVPFDFAIFRDVMRMVFERQE